MKKYFLSFVLAVLVVLAGLSLRRTLAAGTSVGPMSSGTVAIGTSPVPKSPIGAVIGTSPVPKSPVGATSSQAE